MGEQEPGASRIREKDLDKYKEDTARMEEGGAIEAITKIRKENLLSLVEHVKGSDVKEAIRVLRELDRIIESGK